MSLSDEVPLVMPNLLAVLRDGWKQLPKRPPASRHLESYLHVRQGNVLSALFDLVRRPDVWAVWEAAPYQDKRDVGIRYAAMFKHLHDTYGRIAPIGFFWRAFYDEVLNGGHDQYCFNKLIGAEAKDSPHALLTDLIKVLALDGLPGGATVLDHLEQVQAQFLKYPGYLLWELDDDDESPDWDAFDDKFYQTVDHGNDGDCPADIWDRHLNARFRAIILDADKGGRLVEISGDWTSLPPPTEKQLYEIEEDRVTKQYVEEYDRRREKKERRRWWKPWTS